MSLSEAETPGRPHAKERGAPIPVLVTVVILAAVIASCIGRYEIPPDTLIRVLASRIFDIERDWPTTVEAVVFQVRLPRICVALLVGAALATSGTTFQGVFRNPLVSPFLLGVSAGAGFGAALAILADGDALTIQLSAFAFSAVAVFCAISLSRLYTRNPTLVLVLAGVIVGSVFTALLSLLKYVADPENKLPVIEYWLLGSLSGSNVETVIGMAVVVLPALAAAIMLRWRLNLLTFGDETARTLGVNVGRERLMHIGLATVLAAAAVAVSGIIGWVGLVVPHLARLLVGPDHTRLLPTALLIGAAFVLVVDTLARTMTSAEVPLGIITALLGAPFFAILLSRGERSWM